MEHQEVTAKGHMSEEGKMGAVEGCGMLEEDSDQEHSLAYTVYGQEKGRGPDSNGCCINAQVR